MLVLLLVVHFSDPVRTRSESGGGETWRAKQRTHLCLVGEVAHFDGGNGRCAPATGDHDGHNFLHLSAG